MNFSSIAGYTYKADILCPECTVERLADHHADLVTPNLRTFQPAAAIDSLAVDLGVNPHDERSFDSDEFPKVVFGYQLESDEKCGYCGEAL